MAGGYRNGGCSRVGETPRGGFGLPLIACGITGPVNAALQALVGDRNVARSNT
jgi:hypothetical protein